jgi:hypothetical protein
MTTTNAIQESNSNTKGLDYVNLSKRLIENVTELGAKDNENFMVKNAYQELMSSYRKLEQANCEYTAYVSCQAIEKWASFITDRI